jgi:nucleoporin POM34
VAQSAPTTPTTGTWKHPKLDEIVRRQNAAKFSADDVKKVLYNLGGVAAVCLLGRSVWDRYVYVDELAMALLTNIAFRACSNRARFSIHTQITSTTP